MVRFRTRSQRLASAPATAALLLSFLATGPAAGGSLPAFGECALRRTEADLRAVTGAMHTWLTSQHGLAPQGEGRGASCLSPGGPGGVDLDPGLYPPISAADLATVLVPTYIDSIPVLDGWGNPYDYRLNAPLSLHVMAARSAGADGIFSGTTYEGGVNAGPADDLVWADARWVRWVPSTDAFANQRQATREIGIVGVAMMSWLSDPVGFAPAAGPEAGARRGTVDVDDVPPISATDLAAVLVPKYIACIPPDDPWGTPYDYHLNLDVFAPRVMAIRSAGSDGLYEGTVYPVEPFPPDDQHRDIAWMDGFFIQWAGGPVLHLFADDFETGDLWGTWSCAPGL